ncbi:MAG: dTMP kinase [Acidobacteriota bacterium]
MPFLTFEGVEGCGKTTQLARAAARLRERNFDVVETREPGGTEIGEKIRDILMDVGNSGLDAGAEWLLLEADRRQHVSQVLQPALERGAFVLCDRYSDSTEAYQANGRGLDSGAVAFVDAIARQGLTPDLTLIYDLDPAVGLQRARGRDGRDGRFESSDMGFHERVRGAYLAIARREHLRVRLLSGDGPPDEIFEATWTAISERFGI